MEKKALMEKIGGQMPSPSTIHLCGQVAGAIHEILPAKTIIDEMVGGACQLMQANLSKVSWPAAKL